MSIGAKAISGFSPRPSVTEGELAASVQRQGPELGPGGRDLKCERHRGLASELFHPRPIADELLNQFAPIAVLAPHEERPDVVLLQGGSLRRSVADSVIACNEEPTL